MMNISNLFYDINGIKFALFFTLVLQEASIVFLSLRLEPAIQSKPSTWSAVNLKKKNLADLGEL